MRDSFGGVFMFRLMIVFIFIFVSFTAVSLNYAKSFRVKNKVIDFIEQNEITKLSGKNFNDSLPKLDAILKSSSYNKVCEGGNGPIETDEKGNVIQYCYNGIIIGKDEKYNDNGNCGEENIAGTSAKRIHYIITTYADWNLGELNKILVLGGEKADSKPVVNGTWTIQGKATVIKNN